MDRNFGKNYKDYVHCKATTFMDNMQDKHDITIIYQINY